MTNFVLNLLSLLYADCENLASFGEEILTFKNIVFLLFNNFYSSFLFSSDLLSYFRLLQFFLFNLKVINQQSLPAPEANQAGLANLYFLSDRRLPPLISTESAVLVIRFPTCWSVGWICLLDLWLPQLTRSTWYLDSTLGSFRQQSRWRFQAAWAWQLAFLFVPLEI